MSPKLTAGNMIVAILSNIKNPLLDNFFTFLRIIMVDTRIAISWRYISFYDIPLAYISMNLSTVCISMYTNIHMHTNSLTTTNVEMPWKGLTRGQPIFKFEYFPVFLCARLNLHHFCTVGNLITWISYWSRFCLLWITKLRL